MTCDGHGHVASACCLIVGVNDFTILEDADSGSAAADIDNCTVSDLEYGRSSSRFIYDVGYFKTGSFEDIADAFDTALGNSWRDCCGTVEKLRAEFFFKLIFKFGDKLNGLIIIDDHTVTDRMGRSRSSGNRAVVAVHNSEYGIGSTKVNADFEPATVIFAFAGPHQFCKIR